MKAMNIEWDTDGEYIDLPNEIDIPEDLDFKDDIEETVSDYLSDTTGFCHKGFNLIK